MPQEADLTHSDSAIGANVTSQLGLLMLMLALMLLPVSVYSVTLEDKSQMPEVRLQHCHLVAGDLNTTQKMNHCMQTGKNIAKTRKIISITETSFCAHLQIQ